MTRVPFPNVAAVPDEALAAVRFCMVTAVEFELIYPNNDVTAVAIVAKNPTEIVENVAPQDGRPLRRNVLALPLPTKLICNSI